MTTVPITTRTGLQLDVRLDPTDYTDPEALARDAVWPAEWDHVRQADQDALVRLAGEAMSDRLVQDIRKHTEARDGEVC